MSPMKDDTAMDGSTSERSLLANRSPSRQRMSALTIDLTPGGTVFRYLAQDAAPERTRENDRRQRAHAAAPGDVAAPTNAPAPTNVTASTNVNAPANLNGPVQFTIAGRPEEALEIFLSLERDLPPLAATAVTVGHLHDPLLPFSGFPSFLRVIEELLRHDVPSIQVRTRSPLIVLLLPLIRGSGGRVSVTIAIETPHDEVARKFVPGLPRPSERLHAATTLARLGIPTVLDVTPIVGRANTALKLARFADTLAATGCGVRVRPLEDVLPPDHPLLRQIAKNAPAMLIEKLEALARGRAASGSSAERLAS